VAVKQQRLHSHLYTGNRNKIPPPSRIIDGQLSSSNDRTMVRAVYNMVIDIVMTAGTQDNLSLNLSFPPACCPSIISPSTPWLVILHVYSYPSI